MHTCTIPALKRAREITNDYVEHCLIRIYDITNEAIKKAYVSSETPTLKEHLYQSLRRTELEPHRTETKNRKMKRCTMTTRKYHTTVMKNGERVQTKTAGQTQQKYRNQCKNGHTR